MNLKANDTVYILAGKDKGKTGKLIKVFPKSNRIVVEGINIVKKHIKKTGKAMQAGIVEFPATFNISKAMLVCPECKKPSRTASIKDGKLKKRVCKKCKAQF